MLLHGKEELLRIRIKSDSNPSRVRFGGCPPIRRIGFSNLNLIGFVFKIFNIRSESDPLTSLNTIG